MFGCPATSAIEIVCSIRFGLLCSRLLVALKTAHCIVVD
jgi:hypothetical protein